MSEKYYCNAHCCDCFESEINGLQSALEITDKLLNERRRVLKAIPECLAHGAECVPHALIWVNDSKNIRDWLFAELEGVETNADLSHDFVERLQEYLQSIKQHEEV